MHTLYPVNHLMKATQESTLGPHFDSFKSQHQLLRNLNFYQLHFIWAPLYLNIVNNCLQHASSFLLIIPHFLIIFTLLTILGNVDRPCKQYTNIVDTSYLSIFFCTLTLFTTLHHVSPFFPNFFLIFSLYLHCLPY